MLFIAGQKRPAHDGRDAQNIEEVRRYNAGLNALWFVASQKRKAHRVMLDHRVECLIMLTIVEHFFDGERHVEDAGKRSLLRSEERRVGKECRERWSRKQKTAYEIHR